MNDNEKECWGWFKYYYTVYYLELVVQWIKKGFINWSLESFIALLH